MRGHRACALSSVLTRTVVEILSPANGAGLRMTVSAGYAANGRVVSMPTGETFWMQQRG
jgi:hypothetical protein